MSSQYETDDVTVPEPGAVTAELADLQFSAAEDVQRVQPLDTPDSYRGRPGAGARPLTGGHYVPRRVQVHATRLRRGGVSQRCVCA